MSKKASEQLKEWVVTYWETPQKAYSTTVYALSRKTAYTMGRAHLPVKKGKGKLTARPG